MRKIFTLLFLVGFILSGANAQTTDHAIGTGTATNAGTTYPCPIQDANEGSRAQYLYRASELTAAGMSAGIITAIKFNVTSLGTFSGNIQDYTISIGSTATTTLTATTWETGAVKKFGPVDYVPTVGVNTFTLTSPFFWNGTDNILIEICNGLAANTTDGLTHNTSNPLVTWTTGLAFNGSHTRVINNGGNLCGTTVTTNTGTQTTRPNIVFSWTSSVCSGTPNGGAATANPLNVCLGEIINLGATGYTQASGLTYQWEVSTNGGTTWSNITGATEIFITTTQSVTSQYRLKITCTASGGVSFSTPIQVTTPPLPSGVYTINPVGGDFPSFNAAYNAIKCGIAGPVTFNVAPGSGPYNEQLIMTAVPNASVVNTVTFRGNGNILNFAATNTNERATIKLKGTRHIIFDSLVINATGTTFGYGVQLMSDADSNIVRKCTINTSLTSTTQNYAGIVINGTDAGPIAVGTVLCDFNTFSNNTIVGGFYGATLVANFSGGANGNNRFINNEFRDFYFYGIYVVGSYNTLIENNRFSRPTRTLVTDFVGIWFGTQKSTGAKIYRNRIFNPFGAALSSTANFYGIHFNNADGSIGAENEVVNNLVGQVNGNGPQYGIANTDADNIWYFHNTVSLDSLGSTSSSLSRAFSQVTNASGIAIYNNIFSITRGGAGAKHVMYYGGAILPAGMDNNDFYINAGGTNNHIGFFTANRTTLANWQTATNLDANSFSANPAFVDPAILNYAPGNAGIDNKGLYLGVDVDINNVSRSFTTPDIGAFEFTPPPCSVPPVKGPISLSATTICQGNPVLHRLIIGPYGSAQTFQWQTSTSATGPFTSIGTPMVSADTTIIANTTLYYRVEIKCGSAVEYSDTVLLTVNPKLPAGAYTINNLQPQTYVPGVAGGNFPSFNAAKNAMDCGILGSVVFNVDNASGPYNEQLKLDSIFGTSPTRTVTFNGNGRTIFFNSTNTNERAVIKLNRADYIIFDSLTIDASGGSFGYGVQLINNADTNTFRKCTIITNQTSTSNGYAGIVINATDAGPITAGNTWCDGNTFDRNTIIGGFYGVTAIGGTTAVNYIADNKFTNNTISDFFFSGIQVAGTVNTLIEGNTFNRPARANNNAIVYGIQLSTVASNRLTITRNRFENMFGGNLLSTSTVYGIHHNNVTPTVGNDNTVSNNQFNNLRSNGPIYAIYNTGTGNINYLHNTIALDDTSSTGSSATVGFYQTTVATGIRFLNNIITIRRTGLGAKHAIYMNSSTSDVTSNYNDFFVNAGGTNNHVGFFTTNRTTLTDWRVASGKDANSLSIDPLYVNPLAGNLRPATTPLDNKGTPVGVTVDILNAARSATTPDMGAYEFLPPSCVNPPVAGTASVSPVGICLETPIRLTLDGHSPIGSITFQWETSSDGVVWKPLSGILYSPTYDTLATTDTLYRCRVTCDGVTRFSTITNTSINSLLLSGVYTIDPLGSPNYPTGRNFPTFQGAVSALQCGLAGKVTFNVAAGTYNEQIRVPYISGTSSVRTVTFQSANGVASSVDLTFNSITPASNYTLRLDSATNFIFKDMTISATNAANGRAIDITGTASFDSIVNCIVTTPVVSSTSNANAAIYANAFRGRNIVIRGNTIQNGSHGIFFTGPSTVILTNPGHVIDSNNVSGSFFHGMNIQNTNGILIRKNTVSVSGAVGINASGIYTNFADSAFRLTGNLVNINNVTSGLVYGIHVQNSRANMSDSGIVAGNRVIAENGNTNNIYGLTLNASKAIQTVNNVISINTTGSIIYGLYSLNSTTTNYYNNSVSISAPATFGYAAYFNHGTTNTGINIRNNIFSNVGGGRALYVNNPTLFTGDYNVLYTTGPTLVQVATGTPNSFANLATWRPAFNWDRWSISYAPAFTSATNLMPDLANPDVWAIHGRGIQIVGNNYDFNNNPRPVTLLQGVPDMGAYEFFPTALPTVLTGIPAAPAPGTQQTFMYGTDTVMKIKWGSNAPSSITMRRYSGVVPTGLASIPLDSMFFYTQVNIPGGGAYEYNAELFYIDPWLGSMPHPSQIGLGKTTPGNNWVVGFTSRNDVPKKRIWQDNLNTNLDRFTGLINPYAPPIIPDKDSSNRGRRFWVAYPINQLNGGGNQEMVIYLSAQEAANVQVKINGTTWIRNYFVPNNTVVVSDLIPKAGPDNAFLNGNGLFDRGISIESDVPIVAYAHFTGSASSGASMLMPVGVWGFEYKTLGITQNYGANSFAYYNIIADNDNTRIEITSTPGIPVQNAGMTPGVPFIVNLNKGQVYQVVASSQTQELSGSVIRSIPNDQGKCFPIASFSGSSRTSIPCPGGGGSGGDFIMQQNFPSSAWGKRYLTAPTSHSTAANILQTNVYRVAIKDPGTVVRRNGVLMTGLQNNFFYEFNSNTADYIEADGPIMVAQFTSAGNCGGGTGGVGDPEMFYLSPIEQGIDQIGFYRNTAQAITVNYLTLIIPTNGLSSLVMQDAGVPFTPDFTYPHPQNGILNVNYTVVVKRWTSAQRQVTVRSDSAFTAITYGLGSVESYGYNAGTLVKTLKASGSIVNVLDPFGREREFTCANAPFQIGIKLPLKPTSLTWKLSAVPNLTPNADSTFINPVPIDSALINGVWNYAFTLQQNYVFSTPGIYPVQITYSHPSIESCDKTNTDVIFIQVIPSPRINFDVTFSGCVNNLATFRADSTTVAGVIVNSWKWTFHDNTTANTPTATYFFNTPGTFTEKLSLVTVDGCISDTLRQVVVNPNPVVTVVTDSLAICSGTDTTFSISNPIAGATYNWYTTPTGGTPVFIGTVFTVTNVTSTQTYYIEATHNGCTSTSRLKVVVTPLAVLATPVVSVTGATANSVTFNWLAVPGAIGYQVSVNGGAFGTPSSGGTGLTHVVSGLTSLQQTCIVVRAVGPISCQNSESVSVCGCNTPLVVVVTDSMAVCSGTNATFTVQNPVVGTTYSWFDTPTGGTAIATGTSFTVNNVTSTQVFYVEQSTTTGCTSPTRTRVVVSVYAPLATPVVSVTSSTANSVTFSWLAVPGAVSYQVSTNGGTTFVTPSSGATGLTHTVTGLTTLQQACIIVRAVGVISCQNSTSVQVCGCTNSSAVVVPDSLAVCTGTTATFNVQSPGAGITYSWFATATGGTPLATGSSFTTPVVTSTVNYWVQQASATCTSTVRTRVVVTVLAPLQPAVVTSTPGQNQVVFNWSAVPGAASYQVSLDNGATFITPSSGSTGLSHTVTGLAGLQQVTIIVRAIGIISCQTSISLPVTDRALGEQIFIPNTFTPNGDGRNDILQVYGYTIKDMEFLVFNQWGEKISERKYTGTGGPRYDVWDGTYKGKLQPAGVYIYASRMTLLDGTVITRKGSINLVR